MQTSVNNESAGAKITKNRQTAKPMRHFFGFCKGREASSSEPRWYAQHYWVNSRHGVLGFLVKKLCCDFDWNSECNRRCTHGKSKKMSHQLAKHAQPRLGLACFALRLGRYRASVWHLSHCERWPFAVGERRYGATNGPFRLQPPEY